MRGVKNLIPALTACNAGLKEIKFSHQEELDKIRLREISTKYHMTNRGGPVSPEMGQEDLIISLPVRIVQLRHERRSC